MAPQASSSSSTPAATSTSAPMARPFSTNAVLDLRLAPEAQEEDVMRQLLTGEEKESEGERFQGSSDEEWVAEQEDEENDGGNDEENDEKDDEEDENQPRSGASTTGRRRQECPRPLCVASIVNVKRHLMEVHHMSSVAAEVALGDGRSPQAKGRPRRGCPLCPVETVRLDLHLTRKHRLQRGTADFALHFQNGRECVAAVPPSSDLDKTLSEYQNSMMSRRSGKPLKADTAAAHKTGIKIFLPHLAKDAIMSLENVGDTGVKVDELLKTLQPDTVKVYLSYLGSFVKYLASNLALLTKLRLTPDLIKTQVEVISLIGKSLDKDIREQAVLRMQETNEEVTEGMMGDYLAGPRPKYLLEVLGAGYRLSSRTSVEVREGLIVQLLITNGKRAGDLANLLKTEVDKAAIPEDPDEEVELLIYSHKEAKSGKACPVLMDSRLLDQLKKCRSLESISKDSAFIFTSDKGGQISCSTMSKLVDREWKRHANLIGQPLPRLTATRCRKLAVTALRNTGADRQVQRALAKHMAHLPSTADRYYDQATDRQGRSNVLKAVKERYLLKAKEGEEDEGLEVEEDSSSDMISPSSDSSPERDGPMDFFRNPRK